MGKSGRMCTEDSMQSIQESEQGLDETEDMQSIIIVHVILMRR
jgi:hypothetical protein